VTLSGRDPRTVSELAATLLRHVEQTGTVDVRALSRDPKAALAADTSVRVTVVDPRRLPADCSIAAAYDPTTVPATILIGDDASTGRRAFSCLHEYAHHLSTTVGPVVDVLFEEPDGGAALEEDVCDAFASAVLVPHDTAAAAFADGVTARAVATLAGSVAASLEATAVAAAGHLPAPGYVIILEGTGAARFAARGGDVLPVARDTRQTGLGLRTAARTRRGRGRDHVTFGTGNLSPEMFYDAAPLGGWTVAVLVADSPAWEAFTAGRLDHAERPTGYCDGCANEFLGEGRPCPTCDRLTCPRCRACGCVDGLRPARGERPCADCGLTLGPGAFPSAAAVKCRDCS